MHADAVTPAGARDIAGCHTLDASRAHLEGEYEIIEVGAIAADGSSWADDSDRRVDVRLRRQGSTYCHATATAVCVTLPGLKEKKITRSVSGKWISSMKQLGHQLSILFYQAIYIYFY